MKYLKPFNENTDNFKEELQEFCELNLAYLLDEGTKIEIIDFPDNALIGKYNIIVLEIKFPITYWENVKDHMIPFLTRLQNNYQIIETTLGGVRYDAKVKGAIWDFPKPLSETRVLGEFTILPFYIKDIIKDEDVRSLNVRHFSGQVKLDDLVIKELQFFVER
jgi:hypothetical protein